MEKPKFGFFETLGALPKLDKWFYRVLLLELFRGKLNSFKHQINVARMKLNLIILQQRFGMRNEDGSMNWPNFYAAVMQLDGHVKRSDIFPNGTGGMTDSKILEDTHDFLRPLSAKFNFGPLTTAFDPVEFPEVIDRDFHEIASKINALPFAKTGSSCSGHDYKDNGYLSSHISLSVDWEHKNSKVFLNKLKSLVKQFTQNNVKAKILCAPDDELHELGGFSIDLWIDPLKDWKEKESPLDVLTPSDFFKQIISEKLPEAIKENGSIDDEIIYTYRNLDKWRNDYERYAAEYYKRKNAYQHSDECKAIRDTFWAEVGKIADEMAVD